MAGLWKRVVVWWTHLSEPKCDVCGRVAHGYQQAGTYRIRERYACGRHFNTNWPALFSVGVSIYVPLKSSAWESDPPPWSSPSVLAQLRRLEEDIAQLAPFTTVTDRESGINAASALMLLAERRPKRE